MRIKFLPLFVIALCLLSLPLLAQEVAEPTAEINWPPPVYVLRGEASLRGTVNLAGMTGYFIEYRALDEDLSAPASRLWLPITLPTNIPVVEDVLGTWDTRRVTDGLYELRLNVIVSGFRDVTPDAGATARRKSGGCRARDRSGRSGSGDGDDR